MMKVADFVIYTWSILFTMIAFTLAAAWDLLLAPLNGATIGYWIAKAHIEKGDANRWVDVVYEYHNKN